MSSIIDFDILKDFIANIHDKKRVLVGGCFDVIHFGHIEFLKKAKEQGDVLIIALEPDEFIRVQKKRIPVHNQDERAEILASIRYVDVIVKLPFLRSDKGYFDLTLTVGPQIIAVSEGDSQLANKKKQAATIGAKVKIVTPIIKDFSSSKIINHATISSN